jgi:hypothetical protein
LSICSSREDFAEALETDQYGVISKFTEAIASPTPCQLVDSKKAPVKENIIPKDIDLMKMLPIPVQARQLPNCISFQRASDIKKFDHFLSVLFHNRTL